HVVKRLEWIAVIGHGASLARAGAGVRCSGEDGATSGQRAQLSVIGHAPPRNLLPSDTTVTFMQRVKELAEVGEDLEMLDSSAHKRRAKTALYPKHITAPESSRAQVWRAPPQEILFFTHEA